MFLDTRPQSFIDGKVESIILGQVEQGLIFRHNKNFYKKHSMHLAYNLAKLPNGKYEFLEINTHNYFTQVGIYLEEKKEEKKEEKDTAGSSLY